MKLNKMIAIGGLSLLATACNYDRENDMIWFPKENIEQETQGDSTNLYLETPYYMCAFPKEKKNVKRLIGKIATNNIDTIITQEKENMIVQGMINEELLQDINQFYKEHRKERTLAPCEEDELHFKCDSTYAQIPLFPHIDKATIYLVK